MRRTQPKNGASTGRDTVRRLMLFVAGEGPNSAQARANLRRLLDALPDVQVEVDVIDVLEDFRPAIEHKVVITPCLIMVEPKPRVTIVGTLEAEEQVRLALRLPETSHA